MSRYPGILLLCFLCTICKAQILLQQTEIKLPDVLSAKEKNFEFSGLARWNEKVLLIPTLKKDALKKGNPIIYALSEKEVADNIVNPLTQLTIQNVEIDSASFSSYVSNVIGYDGIEAAVVVGTNIYFSVETDGNSGATLCYIVKGIFDVSQQGKPVIYLQKRLSLDKRVFLNDEKPKANSGFESMAFLPSEKKIIAFFEDPDTRGRHSYYKIDPDLKESSLFILNDASGDRFADMSWMKGSKLVGISSRFKKVSFSHSALLEIDPLNNNVKEIGTLCINNCEFNWEGILPFKDGALLINDNIYGADRTSSKLIYVAFPD